MHLFVVSEDLGLRARAPQPAARPFRLTHRFAARALPAPVRGRGAQARARRCSTRRGRAGSPAAAAERRASTRVADRRRPVAGRTLVVNALLTDEGRPVRDLEPWLGAIGHLLLVTRDGETFAHSHPDDREPGVGKDGRIPFLVRLPRAGPYKGWLQFQRRGKVETLEVAFDAAPYSAPR
jgi:hypothetical protein